METTRKTDPPVRVAWQVLGATLVLLLATVVFVMAVSGSFRNYLQDWLGPWLLAAAVAMGALALWTLLDATDKVAGLRGDSHGHGSPRVALLLLVPTLLFAVSAPTTSNTVEFPPLPADSVTEMSVQDFEDRYAFGDPKLLAGRPVRLLGFVARQAGLAAGQWSVNRFRIYCCVADATLFTVPVEGADRPEGEKQLHPRLGAALRWGRPDRRAHLPDCLPGSTAAAPGQCSDLGNAHHGDRRASSAVPRARGARVGRDCRLRAEGRAVPDYP